MHILRRLTVFSSSQRQRSCALFSEGQNLTRKLESSFFAIDYKKYVETLVHVQIVSAQIVSGTNGIGTNCIGTICSGTICIGHKLYRAQTVLGTNCIEHKLYRAQIVSLYGTEFIRDKVYTGQSLYRNIVYTRTKFIRGQSLYGTKFIQ